MYGVGALWMDRDTFGMRIPLYGYTYLGPKAFYLVVY